MDPVESGDARRRSSLGRPEPGVTFTKIHCWMLIQYSKCVFLGADTLVSSASRMFAMATAGGIRFKSTKQDD